MQAEFLTVSVMIPKAMLATSKSFIFEATDPNDVYSSGIYYIHSIYGSRVMTVQNGSTSNGANKLQRAARYR